MILILIQLLYLTLPALCEAQTNIPETSVYFNTSFLIHYDEVSKRLIEDGFQNIYFPSEDNLSLNGLWLNRESAACNVILCSGFYPGRKEGLAAFYHLLPTTCNMLLFDARGHGTSEGRFLCNLPFYGAHEYKDIIGGLQFIRSQNTKPIFILGMCAGAFHSIKAIHHLQTNKLQSLMPAGMILDSSILSLHAAYEVPKKYFTLNILPNMLRRYIYPQLNKKEIQKSLLYAACYWCSLPIISMLEYFLYPCTLLRNDLLDLTPLCNEIKIPLFFIHAQDDAFAPCNVIQSCSNSAYKTWWPEHAEHACIYLQHKHAYQAQVKTFISDIIENI
jgi:pimeloyl-ACP methyl ester carboxylesterase